MSLAGARSSLGDYYQTCVALQYAVPLLLGTSQFHSIEVEVTSLDEAGNKILVDDIVLRSKTESTLYVQCKKNSPDHGEWTVNHLKPDLLKAAIQLTQDSTCEVVFHSRSGFGRLLSLRERLDIFPTLVAFEVEIPEPLSKLFESFVAIWEAAVSGSTRIEVFESLRRIRYSSPLDISQIHEYCRSNLSSAYANPLSVIELLIAFLTQASSKHGSGGSVLTKHIFSEFDLREKLYQAGFNSAPNLSEKEILEIFRNISAGGRSWPRTIRGSTIPRTALGELLEAIHQGVGSILVTDIPGSGKTCLLMDFVESLEAEGHHGVLFIQGREFEGCEKPGDLADAGIPNDLVGLVDRLSICRPVVVVMDSLDVLSIARNHQALKLFLGLLDRLVQLKNVSVVVACRTFDLKNEPRLSERVWGLTIHLGPLEWDKEISPLLGKWGLAPSTIPTPIQRLLTNPRNLAIFSKIAESGHFDAISTEQELTTEYLDRVVLKDPELGSEALDCLSGIAESMLLRRRTKLLGARVGVPPLMLAKLESAEIILRPSHRELAFGHQTMIDVLVIRSVLGKGGTLLSFILGQTPVPFIRPLVRSFYLFLRAHDSAEAEKQFRVVIESIDVAYHLKRLIVESWSEQSPLPTDAALVKQLFVHHKSLFRIFLTKIKDPSWLAILESEWWTRAVHDRDSDLISLFLRVLPPLAKVAPQKVVSFWLKFLTLEFLDRDQVAGMIAIGMQDFPHWHEAGVHELLKELVACRRPDHDFVGRVLEKFVNATGEGDSLLWRYIVHASNPEEDERRTFGWNLHCGPNAFNDHSFLRKRMETSELLLNQALEALEERIQIADPSWKKGDPCINLFLDNSSWRNTHHEIEHQMVDGCSCLLDAIEHACISHASRSSTWWQGNRSALASAGELTLRYIHLKACTEFPETNLDQVRKIWTSGELLRSTFLHEMATLAKASFPYLEPVLQDDLQQQFMALGTTADPDMEDDEWLANRRCGLLRSVPAYLRTPEAQAFLDSHERVKANNTELIRVTRRSWSSGPTYSDEDLNDLSIEGLIKLIEFEEMRQLQDASERFPSNGLAYPLQRLATQDPERMIRLLERHSNRLARTVLISIVEGIGRHLQIRHGNLIDQSLSLKSKPSEIFLAEFLLGQLERFPAIWLGEPASAEILLGLSNYVDSTEDALRATLHLWSLARNSDPSPGREDSDLTSISISTVRGRAATATIQLTNHLLGTGIELSPILNGLLLSFASDPHPAVRCSILRGLPYTQHKNPMLGWELFDRCMIPSLPILWKESERCFYYGYHKNFERIRICLDRILDEGLPEAGDTWGRISALSCLCDNMDLDQLFEVLGRTSEVPIWEGAAQVFAANMGVTACYLGCVEGLRRLVAIAPEEVKIGHYLAETFSKGPVPTRVPKDLIEAFFSHKGSERLNTYRFMKWVKDLSEEDCDLALDAMEIMASSDSASSIHDHESLTAALTTLMREGELQEILGHGEFLRRAIKVQDRLMELHVYGIDDWLAAAERP